MNWLGEQIDWFKSIFSEGIYTINGVQKMKGSSKRVGTMMVIWVFIFSYGRIAWAKQDLLDIPVQWAITLPILLGIQVASNAVQKMKDQNAQDISVPPPTR